MEQNRKRAELPPIPAKRYFTIGEVSELCGVKPHVLRYWEQEFTQLKPVKRRGNRRYYQHHEVLLIRRIRELLYEEGFTISGARNRLDHSFADKLRRQRCLLHQSRETARGSGYPYDPVILPVAALESRATSLHPDRPVAGAQPEHLATFFLAQCDRFA